MVAELFPFEFFDPIRKRWISARYKATPDEIAARYEKVGDHRARLDAEPLASFARPRP